MTKSDCATVIRISIGHFKQNQLEIVIKTLEESQVKLRPAIERLQGNLGYYVGVDKDKLTMTNVSLWRTMHEAQQMSTLKEMQELKVEFQSLSVEFLPIMNHELLWQIE